MVITPKKVAFLTSHKKAQILEGLKSTPFSLDIEVVTLGRDKELKKSDKQFKELWGILKTAGSAEKLKLGALPKDKFEGPMTEEWSAFLSASSTEYNAVDVSSIISSILAIKDDDEQKLISFASKTSSVVMKEHLMQKILTVIDSERKVSHSKLSEDVDTVITEQLKRFKTKLPPTMNLDFVDICYPPIIQSGSSFSLKPSAVSNDDQISFNGVIMCSLGVRYKSYCSNIGRSFLIDPTKVLCP